MFNLRHLLLLLSLLVLLSTGVYSEVTSKEPKIENPVDYQKFQELLAGVDESSIHSALHKWSDKFRDGIFSKDRTAIEAVHSENPRLATKLVHLAKRAGSNSTTTHQSSTPSHTPTTTASEESSSTLPAIATSTVAETITTTDASGSQTTLTSSFRRVSSLVLQTITGDNGQQSTVTGFTVVNLPATSIQTPTGEAGATATSGNGNPSLQSGAAVASSNYRREMLAMVGGAVAVAMAMH